jgi:hypothetical protein
MLRTTIASSDVKYKFKPSDVQTAQEGECAEFAAALQSTLKGSVIYGCGYVASGLLPVVGGGGGMQVITMKTALALDETNVKGRPFRAIIDNHFIVKYLSKYYDVTGPVELGAVSKEYALYGSSFLGSVAKNGQYADLNIMYPVKAVYLPLVVSGGLNKKRIEYYSLQLAKQVI